MSFEDKIRKVVPYVPGEQPKVEGRMIKLNTNEFPYPPAPGVREALKNLDPDLFRLYPDVYGDPLREKIAEYYGVDPDEVFVGVGSDDVLSVAFMTFFNSSLPVLFPDITYSFYDVWASVYRIPYELVPLKEDFTINREDYYRENGGIVIANPNAPTGIFEKDPSFFEDILSNNSDSVVIADEAYIDFAGASVLPLTKKYRNLLVVQTFSKSRASAGLRIGFAIGDRELIRNMNNVKFSINSYTMSRAAIILGIAALSDREYFKFSVSKVIETREKTVKELSGLGFNVLPSGANFVFCSHKEKKATDIFNRLKEKNIFVRYFNKPRIDDHLRITIGTPDQMDHLIRELSIITGE